MSNDPPKYPQGATADLKMSEHSVVIARSLVASGLMTFMGIHHRNKYNPFCLADDIMEPYRPYVDLLVQTIARKQKTAPEIIQGGLLTHFFHPVVDLKKQHIKKLSSGMLCQRSLNYNLKAIHNRISRIPALLPKQVSIILTYSSSYCKSPLSEKHPPFCNKPSFWLGL